MASVVANTFSRPPIGGTKSRKRQLHHTPAGSVEVQRSLAPAVTVEGSVPVSQRLEAAHCPPQMDAARKCCTVSIADVEGVIDAVANEQPTALPLNSGGRASTTPRPSRPVDSFGEQKRQQQHHRRCDILGLSPSALYNPEELRAAFEKCALEACDRGRRTTTKACAMWKSSSLRDVAEAFEALVSEPLAPNPPPFKGKFVEGQIESQVGVQQRHFTEGRGVAPIAQYSGNRAGRNSAAKPATFLARLHGLLRLLSPDSRRTVLAERLTQAQRLALESWMLERHRSRSGSSFGDVSQVARNRSPSVGRAHTLGSCIWKSAGDSYCAAITLERNLCMQSACCRNLPAAVHALATLIQLRARCFSLVGRTFEDRLVTAVEELKAGPGAARLFLRTRISFANGLRLSTPLCQDVWLALRDRQRLDSAKGPALLTGGLLRPAYTPEAAEEQWMRTCEAWLAIWAERGKSVSDLRKQLATKEPARKAACTRAAHSWRSSQERAIRRIQHLLDAQAQKQVRHTVKQEKCRRLSLSCTSGGSSRGPAHRGRRHDPIINQVGRRHPHYEHHHDAVNSGEFESVSCPERQAKRARATPL